MRKLLISIVTTGLLVLAGLIGGATPALAGGDDLNDLIEWTGLCGPNAVAIRVTTAYGGDVECNEIPSGDEIGVGVSTSADLSRAYVVAGGYWCFGSGPNGYACINPQNFAIVHPTGHSLALAGVCSYPDPCTYVYVYTAPGSAGAGYAVEYYGWYGSYQVP